MHLCRNLEDCWYSDIFYGTVWDWIASFSLILCIDYLYYYVWNFINFIVPMNTTMTLLSRLSKSEQKEAQQSPQASPTKISIERSRAERKYKNFTSLTKNEQLE